MEAIWVAAEMGREAPMRMPPFRLWQWMKRKIGPAAEDRVGVYELRDHQGRLQYGKETSEQVRPRWTTAAGKRVASESRARNEGKEESPRLTCGRTGARELKLTMSVNAASIHHVRMPIWRTLSN